MTLISAGFTAAACNLSLGDVDHHLRDIGHLDNIDDLDNVGDLDNIGHLDNIDDLSENNMKQRDQLTFISASFTAAAPNPHLGDHCGDIEMIIVLITLVMLIILVIILVY